MHEDGTPLSPDEFPGRRVLAGQPAEPMVARMVSASGEERWTLTKATPVRDRQGRVTLVVNVIEDITAVKRSERAQRLLVQAGEVLASSLDYERTLQQVAELAVPELADWCAVSLPDHHGYLRRTVAVAHKDPRKLAWARRVAERYPTAVDAPTGLAQVLRDGVSQLSNDVNDQMLAAAAEDAEHAEALSQLGMRAAMVVPLTGAARTLGTLSLVSAESGRTFTPDGVALAEELGRRAGSAVDNARQYTERSRIARTLQSGLLPDALPTMPGWRAHALYRPADSEENWVGGDFYDAVAVPGGWLALVGDVAGRGADAAALTALARHTLRATAKLLPDPLDAIARLNDELVAREKMSLCTVGAALLREYGGYAVAELVCAGHPQALLINDGEVSAMGCFGPMLGAYATGHWERVSITVEPGATLVLFTDGVLDTVGPGAERFGEQRLTRALAGVSDAEDAVASIDEALRAFQVGGQADDTAVLALQRVAAPARETSHEHLSEEHGVRD